MREFLFEINGQKQKWLINNKFGDTLDSYSSGVQNLDLGVKFKLIDVSEGLECFHKCADIKDFVEMFEEFISCWYNGSNDEAFSKYIQEFDEICYKSFEDSYRGEYESKEEYAIEYVESIGELPKESHLRDFIDWSRYADYLMEDMVFVDGYVFSNY